MVEPISPRPVSKPDRQVAPVAPAVSATPANAHANTVAAELTLSAIAFGFTEPPIDQDRVAQFRKAIRDNHYQIRPDRIADRLLAAKTEWSAK